MTLTCPHCGYSRELPAERRPVVTVRVTCPRCREQFQWAAAPSFDSEPATDLLPAPPLVAVRTADSSTPAEDPARAAALPKAGFWIRLVAALVDSTLVGVLQVIFGSALIAAALMLTGNRGDAARALGMLIAWSFGPVLGVVYYVGFTGYCGQTPGKMALRVKVICCDGRAIGYGRAFFRETLGKLVSMLILGIGYLMVAFDGQKQGLHDKLADTYVIKL
jgi:uncharacterized RDD family membrane protein YckC